MIKCSNMKLKRLTNDTCIIILNFNILARIIFESNIDSQVWNMTKTQFVQCQKV